MVKKVSKGGALTQPVVEEFTALANSVMAPDSLGLMDKKIKKKILNYRMPMEDNPHQPFVSTLESLTMT
eukprot:16663-Eustigmatos_ZCMA.PRE.1